MLDVWRCSLRQIDDLEEGTEPEFDLLADWEHDLVLGLVERD